jgi:hypothetical protein
LMAEVRFATDSLVEEAVKSEPVSEPSNSLIAGKIQGILLVWASDGGCRAKSSSHVNAL